MELARKHLAMFVRPPVVGQVKTRLSSVLGATGATLLYRAFVDDTVAIVQQLDDVDVTLWTAGSPTDEVFRWALELEADIQEQPNGSLGARLEAAFEHGFGRSANVVAIGSDAPTLPHKYLAQTFDLLDDAELALGPSADGGYFSIGARRAPKLSGIRWSTADTLSDTVRVNELSRIAFTAPWYDVDTPADLYLLRAHLSLDPRAAPNTHHTLAEIRRDSSRNPLRLF